MRHLGILELQPEFATRIDQRQEVAAGALEEIELRSATVQAGALLAQALGPSVPTWCVDFELWQRSHDPDVTVEHHRTTTIYY